MIPSAWALSLCLYIYDTGVHWCFFNIWDMGITLLFFAFICPTVAISHHRFCMIDERNFNIIKDLFSLKFATLQLFFQNEGGRS